MTKKQFLGQLSDSLSDNVSLIKDIFAYAEDLRLKEINLQEKRGYVMYLETLVDTDILMQNYLIPITSVHGEGQLNELINNMEVESTTDLNKVIVSILSGSCILIMEGGIKSYLFSSPLSNVRDPQEPENEKIVKGSHNGFVENVDANINLIRQRIKSQHLAIHYITLGTITNKKIAIVYLKNIANEEIVGNVKKRVTSISTDTVITSEFIEECIEDSPFSPFPQVMHTERPDRVEANIIEGRVAIITDGSADVLIAPITFYSLFQTADDYNNRFYTSSVFRLLRLVSFWGALLLPPLYIAVISFHFEIIPYDMILLVKSSIETVPFPPFTEALMMAVTLELIREAGIRLPTPIGQTIGIVGGLIIGESVVNAGLVSNVMVIVIALTAIMSFSLASYELGNTVRVYSFPIMIAAALFGFVGIIISFMFIIIHLCKLESFGVSYFYTGNRLDREIVMDTFVRLPILLHKKRPKALRAQKSYRIRPFRKWKIDE